MFQEVEKEGKEVRLGKVDKFLEKKLSREKEEGDFWLFKLLSVIIKLVHPQPPILIHFLSLLLPLSLRLLLPLFGFP